MGSANDRIILITDLLLGAVYADDELNGDEEQTLRKLLGDLLGGAALPPEVESRIQGFLSSDFNLEAAARDFATDPPVNKRQLLELVAIVRDADGEIDLAEDRYMTQLGEALGMDRSEYADLTLEYEVEDLRSSLQQLRKPPPIPS